MAAIRTGDYARAHDLLQHTAEAGTQVGKAIGALLLALIERFDEADRLLEAADVPAFRVVLQGERQRATRWRDPAADGSLNATTSTPLVPVSVAIGCAFVHDDDDLANRAKALAAERAQPIAGKLTLAGGEVRPFSDITDADDGIGQMLETYCDEGLLYFPFSSLRRVEVLPRSNFMDHLMPKVKITDEHGTATAYVPLLYACSATSANEQLRTGQATAFAYLGSARRGRGQRDFELDGSALVGFQRVAAIDFA